MLANAAKCRAEADWLIGINGTRAITTKMFPIISRQVATVERVQPLTLAMIVKRDFEIDNLKPTTVWKISGKFLENLGFVMTLKMEPFKKSKNSTTKPHTIESIDCGQMRKH